nr:MAG TPA: hypothetical protein [Caudoviricetes sp.]
MKLLVINFVFLRIDYLYNLWCFLINSFSSLFFDFVATL